MNPKQMDEYLKTLAGAFAWVASADSGVSEAEHRKFEHVIVESQFATQFKPTDIEHYFKDMVAMFADDFEAAAELTKTRLRKVRGQDHLAEEVIRICRAAIVGDGDLEEAEELALAAIAKELGLNADV